jgi:hypothetical protein
MRTPTLRPRARHLLAAVAGLWLLSAAPAVMADQEPAKTKTDLRAKAKQDGFQPVAGAPDTQKIDASKLVIAAYATFFFGMFGYIVYVARTQSAMSKEMAALAEQIARVENKS